MKRIVWLILALASCIGIKAEDGSRLWLRYDKVQKAQVTGPECIAAEELRTFATFHRVEGRAYCLVGNQEALVCLLQGIAQL